MPSEERRQHKKKHDPNVFDPNPTQEDEPRFRKTPRHQTYTIQEGDTLKSISAKFYDDEAQWRRILEVNDDTIDDPDYLHPGTELKIPGMQRDV